MVEPHLANSEKQQNTPSIASQAEALCEQWVRPQIRDINAYHVPNPGNMIKLDAMENPYRWPAEMTAAWAEKLIDLELNRYPDPGATQLADSLRVNMQIPDDMAMMLGNGSDELIQIVCMAVAGVGRTVMSIDPGFVMYKMIADFTDMEYVGVPLKQDDFGLDEEAMLAAIQRHQPAVVFLTYPNNPTGGLFDREVMDRIILACPGLVVIDEAYHAFALSSYMDRLGEFPNLLVMRTVSKLGLAGLRLGVVAGSPSWINEFDKIRLPYNINVLTQATVRFALEYGDVLEQQTAKIREQREVLYQQLSVLGGLHVYPSAANFLLVRLKPHSASAVFEGLKRRGVLVKNLDKASAALQGCLRLTVGLPEENAMMIDALRAELKGPVGGLNETGHSD